MTAPRQGHTIQANHTIQADHTIRNVLLIGSGGREHAMAWKVAQSPLLRQLYIAPGNPGTAQLGINVPIPSEGNDAHRRLIEFALENEIDLVMIGPEAPLAGGLSDRLRSAGVAVFGPSQAAAQIEASKAFAKDFMLRHDIPTAHYTCFELFEPALTCLREAAQTSDSGFPLVIKASGLAAGKGVIIPQSLTEAESALRSIMVDQELGAAGECVILEEKLEGEEVSLLAFTDGHTVRVMPPAQDHKRLLIGDQGPNTGGMGAFAPAAICTPQLVEEITHAVLQRAVDGMRSEGVPFTGVLYAGMILTSRGPKVLEFNCRFGDPETQVLLPLLKSDLLEIAQACAQGSLSDMTIEWECVTGNATGAAACIVLASEGYPAKPITGRPIQGLGSQYPGTLVFQAGTKHSTVNNGEVLTAGGRVLGVTGLGHDLPGALDNAYKAVQRIHFDGMVYRTDIGSKNRSA
jgi:phosphoribosylamine---glycine ligase